MTDTKPTPRTYALAAEITCGRDCRNYLIDAHMQLERELSAIKSQPVPVEPEMTRADDFLPTTYVVCRTDYDSLQSALHVAQMERDGYLDLYRDCAEIASDHIDRADKAEERNKQLVELLKALLGALKHPVPPTQKQWDAIGVVSDNILLEMGK
jgi:hypothetical protein